MTELLIVGAGAIGGTTAAVLAAAGAAVTVLDPDQGHVDRIRKQGLRLDTETGSTAVPLEAYARAEDLPRTYEAALLAVKGIHLEVAVPAVAETGRVRSLVSLGNGLIQHEVERLSGTLPVVWGIVEWGATNHGPGHLERTTMGPFVLGGPDDATHELAESIGEALAQAWPVCVSRNIIGHVWAKLLLNSAFSGIGTVIGGVYDDVIEHPTGRALAVETWREGLRVAAQMGLTLPEVAGIDPQEINQEGPRLDAALAALQQRVGPTKASMLQDLERGSKTEVRWINGGVRLAARPLGVATPLNSNIERSILSVEQGAATPGLELLTLLARLPRQ